MALWGRVGVRVCKQSSSSTRLEADSLGAVLGTQTCPHCFTIQQSSDYSTATPHCGCAVQSTDAAQARLSRCCCPLATPDCSDLVAWQGGTAGGQPTIVAPYVCGSRTRVRTSMRKLQLSMCTLPASSKYHDIRNVSVYSVYQHARGYSLMFNELVCMYVGLLPELANY